MSRRKPTGKNSPRDADDDEFLDDAPVMRGRRGPRPGPHEGLERIAEVHYCRTDSEANQYLALGPEWDLQDIIPMRTEGPDGAERDEIHYVVARWETDTDRARLRQRDRITARGKKLG